MGASSWEISDVEDLMGNERETVAYKNSSIYSSLASVDDSSVHPEPMEPSLDTTGKPVTPLIEKINRCLFKNSCTTNNSNFPMLVKFPYAHSKKQQIYDFLNQFEVLKGDIQTHEDDSDSGIIEISCTVDNKSTADMVIYALKDHNDCYPDNTIEYVLDYSNFLSHPGIMFIKNLSKRLITKSTDTSITIHREDPDALSNPFFSFLLESCHFASLKETKLFTNESSSSTCFAIVTFENYLDVDFLIAKLNKIVPNVFNENPTVPLYLNKYLHKRERVSSSPSRKAPMKSTKNQAHNNTSSTVVTNEFDTIFMENLSRFFPADLSLAQLGLFIDKFLAFEVELDAVYLPFFNDPIESENPQSQHQIVSSSPLKLLDYGYLKFRSESNILVKTLTILYYLNNLTWLQFLAIDQKNLEPLTSAASDNQNINYNHIRLTIAQYKHNSFLYRNANFCYFSLLDKSSTLISNLPNPLLINKIFSKLVNYQETNIYVNNLPILFNNNDELWESFWKQFGEIKSAKIIKPQFYKEESDEEYEFEGTKQKPNSGKIGFVFYIDFKMALRLVLLTNNKLVNVNGSNNIILIQSSFALQKPNTKSNVYQLPPQPNGLMINNQQSYQPVLESVPSIPQPIFPNVLHYPYVPYMNSPSMLQQLNTPVPYYNPFYFQNTYPPEISLIYQQGMNYGAQQSGRNRKYGRGKKNQHKTTKDSNEELGYIYNNPSLSYSGYSMSNFGYYYNSEYEIKHDIDLFNGKEDDERKNDENLNEDIKQEKGEVKN